MFRFPIPEGRADYESSPAGNRIAIPYAMMTAPEFVGLTEKPLQIRVILPLAAAEESKFIKNALEGLRGLPGCESALLATSLDASPSWGGGGGIRSTWEEKIETTASRKYKSYAQRFVLQADKDSDSQEDEEDFERAIAEMDEAEEQEAFYGQTINHRRYPPASLPLSTLSREEDEDDGSTYICFCSNSAPNIPTFPMKILSSTTLQLLAFVMVKRALFSTVKSDKPFDAATVLLDSLGTSPEAHNDRVDFMIAASYLQV
eukprot:gene9117-6407_t